MKPSIDQRASSRNPQIMHYTLDSKAKEMKAKGWFPRGM
jgi:hypothetical protein